MIESATVSIPEGCTNNIPMTHNPYMSTKKPSARKPLCQFTEILDVKNKISVCSFGSVKEKCKANKKINVLC